MDAHQQPGALDGFIQDGLAMQVRAEAIRVQVFKVHFAKNSQGGCVYSVIRLLIIKWKREGQKSRSLSRSLNLSLVN